MIRIRLGLGFKFDDPGFDTKPDTEMHIEPDRYTVKDLHVVESGKRENFHGLLNAWGALPSLKKYICYMFDSRTVHLN